LVEEKEAFELFLLEEGTSFSVREESYDNQQICLNCLQLSVKR
jgi:hypothetical protein